VQEYQFGLLIESGLCRESKENVRTNEKDSQYEPYSLFVRIKEMQETLNELKARIVHMFIQ